MVILETNKIICSGVQFGFFGLPLHFEVTSENVPEPYPIEFIVLKDKQKKSFEIEFKRKDTRGTVISFYNPTIGGTSGLKAPLSVLILEEKENDNIKKYILGFMFHIDTLNSVNTYRIAYEFYDGLLIVAPEKEGAK